MESENDKIDKKELHKLEQKLKDELNKNVKLYSQQCKAFTILRRITSENDTLLDALSLINPELNAKAEKLEPAEKADNRNDEVDWNSLCEALFS
ncbi:hypothetical protein DASB73_021370 [Starmerella bacillaris]|uniref:Uncharacterized protein n=1 Tax=Starmerella bacillaris TaxID=1247836 RepID=A0AAV5RI31_STABA|nr:hypothetical protein DASB73_021370 [Starmerella bacillaris]